MIINAECASLLSLVDVREQLQPYKVRHLAFQAFVASSLISSCAYTGFAADPNHPQSALNVRLGFILASPLSPLHYTSLWLPTPPRLKSKDLVGQ